ncbi:MAG: hypothetical protein IPO62_13005 [Saprospiraceae bacterium]|nr:hypothetical protein [Saprospiraceae bacterium]
MENIAKLKALIDLIKEIGKKITETEFNLKSVESNLERRLKLTFESEQDFTEYQLFVKQKIELDEKLKSLKDTFEENTNLVKKIIPNGAKVNLGEIGIIEHDNQIYIYQNPAAYKIENKVRKTLQSIYLKDNKI